MGSSPRKLAALGLLLAVVCMACSHRYAVLISTDTVTSDDVAYHSEWWYDLFLQYEMLREMGLEDDQIFVLYGDGTDFATAHSEFDGNTQFGHAITDMAMSRANVNGVFDTLSGSVTGRDQLYVWWMGHGGGDASCNTTMIIGTSGENMTDAQFAAAINRVPDYRERTVTMMTCHSGGLIDDLDDANTNTVVLTSSQCNQLSYDATSTCNGRFHAEFNYTEPNAFQMHDPCGSSVASDGDGSGKVSPAEAHGYNGATMTRSTPQMGDPDGIADTIWLE